MKFYKENTGDYLLTFGKPYRRESGLLYEGRATVQTGMPSSMATTSIHWDYIQYQCQIVTKESIPQEWLEWLQ